MSRVFRNFAFLSLVATLLFATAQEDAFARVGGGRSSGSRGSRSYSRPMAPPSQMPSRQYSPSQPYQGPMTPPYQQPRRPGFGTALLGGLAGGLLGGMLFRGLGFGGGFGGGGIGFFDILILAGIGYLIFRFIKKRSSGDRYTGGGGGVYQMEDYQRQQYQPQDVAAAPAPGPLDVESGIAHIRQMDPSFDERRFGDQVMDMFFRIQGAWMNRDLSGVSSLLTEEMRGILQQDVGRLLSEHQVNRLENIAVRSVEVAEAWQEAGQDYVTADIYANLLDYTTDDRTGAVISGSKTEPVKFEEYWTFTRPVGNNPWRLSAITQK